MEFGFDEYESLVVGPVSDQSPAVVLAFCQQVEFIAATWSMFCQPHPSEGIKKKPLGIAVTAGKHNGRAAVEIDFHDFTPGGLRVLRQSRLIPAIKAVISHRQV